MNLDELQAQLDAQERLLADLEGHRTDLEAESTTLQASKRTLSSRAILDRDKTAIVDLRKVDTRILEIAQDVENTIYATDELRLRIGATRRLVTEETKRVTAEKIVAILRDAEAAAGRFETGLAEAATAYETIAQRMKAANTLARDIGDTNAFGHKGLSDRASRRMGAYFQHLGIDEIARDYHDITLAEMMTKARTTYEDMARGRN